MSVKVVIKNILKPNYCKKTVINRNSKLNRLFRYSNVEKYETNMQKVYVNDTEQVYLHNTTYWKNLNEWNKFLQKEENCKEVFFNDMYSNIECSVSTDNYKLMATSTKNIYHTNYFMNRNNYLDSYPGVYNMDNWNKN